MPRTKATARKTTGGKAPSKTPRAPMPPPDSDSESDSSSSSVALPVVAAKKTAAKKTAASKKPAATSTKKAPSSKKTAPPPEDSSSESESQSVDSSSESVTQSHSSDDDSVSASSSSSQSSEVVVAPVKAPKKGTDKKGADKKAEKKSSKKSSTKEVDPPKKKAGSRTVAPPPLSDSESDSSSSSSSAPPPPKKGSVAKKGSDPKKSETEAISYYLTQADLFKIFFGDKKPDSKIVKALVPYIFTPSTSDVTTVKFNAELGAYVAENLVFDPQTQTVYARVSSSRKIVPLTSKDEPSLKLFNKYTGAKSTYADESEIKALLAASQAFHDKVTGAKKTSGTSSSQSSKKQWGDDTDSEGGDDGIVTDPIDRASSEYNRTRNEPPKITKEIFSKFVVAQRTPDVNRVDAGAIASVAGISEGESREILSKYALYAKKFPDALASVVASDRGRPAQASSQGQNDRGRGATSSGFNQRRSNSAGPSTTGGGRQFSNAPRGGRL